MAGLHISEGATGHGGWERALHQSKLDNVLAFHHHVVTRS
jgi:hypothetical protein